MKSRTLELEPMRKVAEADDWMEASDVWLVPPHGRVVFDERGNSRWQWPSEDDPFAKQDRLGDMDANELRIVEPSEIRRCSRPWLHESERPAKEYRVSIQQPGFAPQPARPRRGR